MTISKDSILDDVFLTLKTYIHHTNQEALCLSPSSLNELEKIVPKIEDEGIGHLDFLKEYQFVLDKSVRTIHPLFLNQLFGGFDPYSWSGELLSTVLNPTMATFEMSSIMTLMEKRMANHLLKLMGISDGEGIMVTGGSNSNLLSMLCARTQYNPSIRQNGHSHNRFRVYVSSESHYSFDKAANICGIGTQNLIQIPCSSNGQMIPEKLHQIIKSDLQDGLVPLMVGATCGTTVLGAFDPLNEIAEICKKYHIWFHADAAWGGAALLNPKHRSLMSGIEKADSIGFDAHKTLGTPLMTSFFLTPHRGILKSTNRGGGAEYLFHDEEESDLDTGTYSLQCGRRADILKLWFLWRAYGNKGIIERTNRLFDLHQYATDKMKHHSRFIVHHSSYLNLCFQVVPINDEREINQFTLQIRQALLKSGKAMINYATRPEGTIFFRLVFPNHLTTKSDIDVLLNILLETANSLEI